MRYRQQWNQRENKKETEEKCLSTLEISDDIHTWTDLGSAVLIQDIQPEPQKPARNPHHCQKTTIIPETRLFSSMEESSLHTGDGI